MKKRISVLTLGIIAGLTAISGVAINATAQAKGDSIVDKVKISVPISCTMTGTGMNSHTAEVNNGLYRTDIGSTTMHIFCNDNEGFAIYAAGYTGDEVGGENSNKLVGTTTGIGNIESGIATSAGNPDISNWAMKLSLTQDSGDTTGTNAFTIDSAPNIALPSEAESGATQAPFSSYHVVPNEYTKVAHKNSGTDMTESTGGAKLTTTYAAYVSKTQPAGNYAGKVKYTLVHPSDHAVPAANPVVLDTGRTVNSKLKSVAATVVNGEETIITPEFDPEEDYDWEYTTDNYIKSIDVHLKTPAPANFTPTEMNTISSTTSSKPVYIIFDNTNDAGVMHFYTEGDQIILPSDASFMFYFLFQLTDLSAISDWDTSSVTDMSHMFESTGANYDYDSELNPPFSFTLDLSFWDTSSVTDMSWMFLDAGYSASTWSIGDLSDWDTSSVTNMSYMFSDAGFSATTWSVGDLSDWDTSSVTDMSYMFDYAGYSATTFTLNLSYWDTSSVTNMGWMFSNAGFSATTWSVGDLSDWDTSSVTDMNGMFIGAGYSAISFALDLSDWDTSSVADMSGMFNCAGYSATTWSVGGLSDWDTSSVAGMSGMFFEAGHSATIWSVGDLSDWNTSSVTDMSGMFRSAGYSATTFALGLSSWDTSSVTDMRYMFENAGYSATSFILDLSSWDTSSVTYMDRMFRDAGYSATAFTLDLSSWDTSSVTNMNGMFSYAGYSASTWSVTIPQTNGNNINNTTSRIYGQTTSIYGVPDSGKSFTLAQP